MINPSQISTQIGLSQDMPKMLAKRAFDARYIRRSKYIARKRTMKNQLYVQPRSTGQPVRLTIVQDILSSALGYSFAVSGLVALLQASNDWNSLKAVYSQYKVNKVHVKIYPGNPTSNGPAAGTLPMAGIAYDNNNNTALSSLNQVSDYQNFVLFEFNSSAPQEITFNFVPRPQTNWPLLTGSSTENMGWLKVATTGDAGNTKTVCKICVIFYVVWGSIE